MPGPDGSERAAFAVVEAVTGCPITHTDDGSQPRQVDGQWRDHTGRIHAVEVTRLLDEHAGQLLAELARRDHRLPVSSLRWAWEVRIEPAVSLRTLEEHLEAMLAFCEKAGLTNPWAMGSHELGAWPLGAHVRSRQLSAVAMPRVPNPDYVWVLPPGGGGAIPGIEAVPPWLSEVLSDPPLAQKVAKLADWEADRRHLFVALHTSAVPLGVVWAITDAEGLPNQPPAVPASIDGIWLASQWASPVVSWRRGEGWDRHPMPG